MCARLPPPTEKTRIASCEESREVRSHASKLVSHPSSFVRAVSSATLSVGCVRLEAAELAEVVDRVRRVRRAAADTQHEEPAAPPPYVGERESEVFDGGRVERAHDVADLTQVDGSK